MDKIASGPRFEFGNNWRTFLSVLNDERIENAQRSLASMLDCNNLRGKTFLDIGSGSGLFSLAARNLGAKVCSFDFDPESVTCTSILKDRYWKNDANWQVEQGSILDDSYIQSLGTFDVVYSWGVLHHTGELWRALENTRSLVNIEGLLFIAIYNDQGVVSDFWRAIKRIYNTAFLGKLLVSAAMLPPLLLQSSISRLIKYRMLGHDTRHPLNRGMSEYHDIVDWLGGYPFEVAKPEQIFEFFKMAGFSLTKLGTTNRNGCNQFVFKNVSITARTNKHLR